MKKEQLFISLFLLFVLISFLLAAPSTANAGWFGETPFAGTTSSLVATVASVFSTLKSFFTGAPTAPEKPAQTLPPVVEANCVPTLPPKPKGFTEHDGRYGPMTVAPIISEAGPNNIITVTAHPDIASRSVSVRANHLSQPGEVIRSPDYTKYYTGLGFELVDWGPKDLAEGKSEPITMTGSVPRSGVIWRMKNAMLPGKIPYWIKVRASHPTIAQRARYPEQFRNGWGTVGYSIEHENQGTSVGAKLIYVGGPQAPSLEINYPGKKDAARKPLTLRPNETFEISAKSLGQAGAITVVPGYNIAVGLSPASHTKILGASTVTVAPNEMKTWKIQPLGAGGVGFSVKLANSCGEDVTTGAVSIQYDTKGMSVDQTDFSLIPRYALVPGRTESFVYVDLKLTSKKDTVVGVPDIPFTIRAVYADNPTEVAKDILLTSYWGSKKERAGEITTGTDKWGTALLKVRAPDLTVEEAKRKIILVAATNEISGLKGETTLPVEVITVKELIMNSSRKIETLKEGERVTFWVNFNLSDITQRTGYGPVTWSVEGPIGKVNSEGLFEAKLADPNIVFGEGKIIARYKNIDGTTVTASSSTVRVTRTSAVPPKEKEVPLKDMSKETPKESAKVAQPKPTVAAKALTITPSRKLEGLKEGDTVIFVVSLQMSDGSLQKLKKDVKWQMVGQIGSVTQEGVFTAKLDPAIAEYGQGIGVITAIYTDSSGKTFLGNTPNITVDAFVPASVETEG